MYVSPLPEQQLQTRAFAIAKRESTFGFDERHAKQRHARSGRLVVGVCRITIHGASPRNSVTAGFLLLTQTERCARTDRERGVCVFMCSVLRGEEMPG